MAIDQKSNSGNAFASNANQQYFYNNSNRQPLAYWSGSSSDFGTSIRRRNIPAGAELANNNSVNARFVSSDTSAGLDWRVKISVPITGDYRTSPILSPLASTDYKVVFPLTPQLAITHTANYDAMTLTHTNYPFHAYSNSMIEEITITAEFPVENETDGAYFLAVIHFFRSMTKMAYGETTNKGAPPNLAKLSGYGDFVLPNVPIAVRSFTNAFDGQVDYIKVPLKTQNTTNFQSDGRYVYIPRMNTVNITVIPIYSRGNIESFSLDKYVNGEMMDKGFL